MIRNFGDHSANERTFLAWVRTAIAVMAFGFLVEKFGPIFGACRSALSRSHSVVARPEIRQHSGTGACRSRQCDDRHCSCSLCDDREEYRPRRPAAGNRIANRHRTCGAAGPSGLRSIPLSVARLCNEALTDFRKRFVVFFRDEITCILSAMQFKSV